MTIQTVDPRALRDAFGAFPTGVTVVTACDGEGHPIGFTANSFTSVSLNPPLLLVCLAKTSRNFATMTGAQHFAINVLSEMQKDVSNTLLARSRTGLRRSSGRRDRQAARYSRTLRPGSNAPWKRSSRLATTSS